MTIITFPIELQEQVYQITGNPASTEPIDITVKFNATLSDEILNQLKNLGVKYLTPIK